MTKKTKPSVAQIFKSGILVLIPTIITFMLGSQLVDILLLLAEPFDAELPSSYILAALIVIAAVFVVIFLAGLAARTKPVRAAANFIEERVLSLIPGYNLVRQMARSKLDDKEAMNWPAVVVEEGSGFAIGVIVEEIDSEFVTVYLPIAPQGFSGITRVMSVDKIRRVPGMDAGDVIDICLEFGKGTAEITKKLLNDEDQSTVS